MVDAVLDVTRFGARYYDWLQSELGMDGHRTLFRILYDTEFTWTVPMDENRAVNGVYMRDRFSYETGWYLPDNWRDHPCCVAEMLAALAFAMEESYLYDPDVETGPDTWMREMLENCGLWQYDDTRCSREGVYADRAIRIIVQRVLQRQYGYSGEGGLFPLKNPIDDQRKVEIWDQMSSYILEQMGF